MKTKFFKKLSFVLALAMVLSVFAPMGNAFAAKDPKLNSASKYLHLGRTATGKNEFNFNIKNRGKGWTYYWESSNEAVATVNEKNGVTTAKAAGKTKITVEITDKDDELVDTLTATVTVRDNIKTVKISNPVETLSIGDDHDYNRSYVTEANKTTGSESVTRWRAELDGVDVSDLINDKGLFVPTKAGEYTITAYSFQSKAKYNAWAKDSVANAGNVLDSDSTTVKVLAGIVGVSQNDKNIFTVEFDSDMKDAGMTDKTVAVSRIINGKFYNTGTEKVKEVSLDATGKKLKVTTYGNFAGKADYQFSFGDMKDTFTAADTDIKEVAGIIFEDFQVKTDNSDPVDLRSKVKAVNKDGVVILHGTDDAIKDYLTFEYKGNVNYGWISLDKAFITKNGESAEFVVKYTNFILDDATNTFKNVEFTASAIGMGLDIVINNTTLEYAVKKIVNGNNVTPNNWDSNTWYTKGFAVPAGDEFYGIYARYKNNTDTDFTVATLNEFNYDSTDTDKMVIYDNRLYPIAQGVVTVLVKDPKNNNAVIGAFDVTVQASRTYVSAVADTYQVSLGNVNLGADSESRTIAVTSTDSMNSPIAVNGSTIELKRYPVGGAGAVLVTPGAIPAVGDWDYGKAYFNVSAVGAEPGIYQYNITLDALNTTKTISVYVTVLDGSDLTVHAGNWRVEMTSGSVDLKGQKVEKSIFAMVYGYNAKNARVQVLPVADYEVAVVKSGTNTGIKFGVTDNEIPVAEFTSGTALGFVDFSTYQVTAKTKTAAAARPAGTIIGGATFKVEDTTPKSFEIKKRSVSAGSAGVTTVHDAIKEAIVVKFDWNDVKDHWLDGVNVDSWTNDIEIEYTLGGVIRTNDGNAQNVVPGDSIFVNKIIFTRNHDNGNSVTYTYDIKQTITISK